MKTLYFLWLGIGFLLVSKIKADVDLSLTDATCDIYNTDMVEVCDITIAQNVDGEDTFSVELITKEDITDSVTFTLDIKKFSIMGDCDVDTGIHLQNTLCYFVERKDQFGEALMNVLDLGKTCPVPVGEYKAIDAVPPHEIIPKNYPPGDYCAKMRAEKEDEEVLLTTMFFTVG